jgi:Helix-turn-helix domain
MASADLLLHPVRLRIIQAFLGDRALTTAQLAAELGDIPPASLYRHVALLTRAGLLQVVAERRVRAVVERTYMLRVTAAQIQPDETAAMTPEQHLAAFMAYTAGMLADAERYLMTGAPDPRRDGARYTMAAMWLTDAELAEFLRDLVEVFQPRLANAPAKGRRRRTVYNVLVPAPEAPGSREAAPKTGKKGAARKTSTTGSGRSGREEW